MLIDNNIRNVFDSLYDGILIIDKNGIVKYINPSYTRITKISKDEILNKKLLDVRKDSHLTKVMRTGKEELGQYRTINNIRYIVNMTPIFENGEIVGGISVVNDMQDIQKTLDKTLLILDNLKEKVKTLNKNRYDFNSIISVDKNSVDLKKYSEKISQNDSNILISGENGTGKKLYAHAIHGRSKRADSPFIVVNCATLDKINLEKELFGIEEENFLEKKSISKIGIFQLADGGTLFLDEISELDYSLQTKIARVLQDKKFKKIGSSKEISIDFRLISSSNRDLLNLVISVIPLNIISLRERRGDIPVLANKFLEDLCLKYRREVCFSEEVMKILVSYHWPGNITELKNIVEFLFNTTEASVICVENLPEYLNHNQKLEKIKSLNDYLKEYEKKYIKKVLNNFEDSLEGKKLAAKSLGISLATLYNKLS